MSIDKYNEISLEVLQKMQLDLFNMQTKDNIDMKFDENSLINLGLNPEYFKSANTSIVNALNHICYLSHISLSQTVELKKQYNNVLLDTYDCAGKKFWPMLQKEMGASTLIEGLLLLYEHKLKEYDESLKLESFTSKEIDDLLSALRKNLLNH